MVIDIGGANAEQSPDFGPPEVDISKKTVQRLSHSARTRQKISHAMQREFLPLPLKFFP